MQVSFLCSLFASILLSNATPWRLQAHGTNESTEDAFHLDVPTSSGTIHGMIDPLFPDVRQFLGIPYALPPVGPLRWLPPQNLPASASEDDLMATHLTPSCMQYFSVPGMYSREVLEFNVKGLNGTTAAVSEDCLTLSIWAPTVGDQLRGQSNIHQNTSLPVIIWVHGGGWIFGGQDVPYQLPTNWVERSKSHIVVALNYRLNIFGYPNARGLAEQNLGLLDLRLAIEWIHTNIGQFGGDRSRIALWGQSAGAGSADYYNFAYHEDPKISSLMLTSGSAQLPKTVDPAHTNFTFVASQLGCDGLYSQPMQQLECMRNISAAKLEDFIEEHQTGGNSPPIAFTPVVDERIIFSNYSARALSGQIAKIPAILGTTDNEGASLVTYHPSGPNVTEAQTYSKNIFFCPTVNTVRYREQAGLVTYRYLYSGNFSNISPRSWMGAYHCSDLPLIFGTHQNYRGASTRLETETSKSMQDAWLALVSSGSKGMNAVAWRPYLLGGTSVRNFGHGVSAKNIQTDQLDSGCLE